MDSYKKKLNKSEIVSFKWIKIIIITKFNKNKIRWRNKANTGSGLVPKYSFLVKVKFLVNSPSLVKSSGYLDKRFKRLTLKIHWTKKKYMPKISKIHILNRTFVPSVFLPLFSRRTLLTFVKICVGLFYDKYLHMTIIFWNTFQYYSPVLKDQQWRKVIKGGQTRSSLDQSSKFLVVIQLNLDVTFHLLVYFLSDFNGLYF